MGKPLESERCRTQDGGAGWHHITEAQGWFAASQEAELGFFLASWVLMEVVGEDGKKENRLQFWG